jgi:radical SAM protein with 4Fe4S-binding SPASM domain
LSGTERRTLPRNFAIRKAEERRSTKLIPRQVIFEVTYRCNLRCIHCGVAPHLNKGPSEELTFAEVNGILDQIFNFGIFNIIFTGGEPFCRPDLLKILDYAKDRGLFFGIKTNGTLVTEKVAQKLKELGTTGVHVSLYGATAKTHERVTGVAGSYDKSIRAIKVLRRHNIQVGVRTSIMKQNCHEDAELKDLAWGLGASYRPDARIYPKDGEPGSADAFRIDDEQLRDFIKRNSPANPESVVDDLSKHLLCTAGRDIYAISPRGEVYPCPTWRMPIGDLKRQTFKEIWNGDAATAIRTTTINDFPTCVNCDLVRHCARCPGLVYAENSDISGPSLESCRVARVAKGVIADGY